MVQTSMQKMIRAKQRKCILHKKDKKSKDIKDTELNNIKKKSLEERRDTIALHYYALLPIIQFLKAKRISFQKTEINIYH